MPSREGASRHDSSPPEGAAYRYVNGLKVGHHAQPHRTRTKRDEHLQQKIAQMQHAAKQTEKIG